MRIKSRMGMETACDHLTLSFAIFLFSSFFYFRQGAHSNWSLSQVTRAVAAPFLISGRVYELALDRLVKMQSLLGTLFRLFRSLALWSCSC